MEQHRIILARLTWKKVGTALLFLAMAAFPLSAAIESVVGPSAQAGGATAVPAGTVALAVEPPARLVGWWPGDANAFDISGHGYHGTLMNGAGLAAGRVGNAFSLNGVNQYVLIPDSTAAQDPNPLDPTVEATLDAWVFFNQVPQDAGHIMTIVAKSGGGRDLDLQAETDGRFHFFVAGGAGVGGHVASTTTILPGQWYFVAGTYEENSHIRLYVNGVLEANRAISVTREANGNPVTIGASYVWGGRFLNGLVDEVELFDRSITATEVKAIFDAGSDGKCKPACTPTPTATATATPTPTWIPTATPTPTWIPTAYLYVPEAYKLYSGSW